MSLFWKILVAFMIAMTVTLVGSVYVSFQLAGGAFDQVNVEGRERIIEETAAALAQTGKLIAAVPAEATQGNNAAKPLYEIGQLKAQARIAAAEGKRDESILLLRKAVTLEDKLAYNEPNDMIFPTRHLLGAELLAAGKPAEAEAVYREDLKRHPNNGWAYLGLSQALAAQKKDADAAAAKKSFEDAWRRADVHLASSAY